MGRKVVFFLFLFFLVGKILTFLKNNKKISKIEKKSSHLAHIIPPGHSTGNNLFLIGGIQMSLSLDQDCLLIPILYFVSESHRACDQLGL